MAPNLANIPDHYLWLGLGVFTFIAIKQVSHGLQHIRTLTEIRKPHLHPTTTEHVPPDPTHQEDAIKTSSLLTLATSPNIDIRASATKILCQRFYASHAAKKLLVKDLNSDDAEIKRRAQLAYNLLYDHGVLTLPMMRTSPREGWRVHEAPVPTLASGGAGDDQDLRRRRREAVVIHDGDVDRPVGQEDVYMRDEVGERQVEPWSEEWDAEESGTF
ncbi:hypothetical protein BDU57DRAFT_522977 [Ampelomyces quisqualis]|uniref:Uncharacterized protein n=1 Tax=Ampelomyces quisqualis TaxID=50730 RepID=A0A6A5QCK5_AMPQU|nr:hypothetical protein BDU57DRAFT_522977 [Ampelomyces quisqualis]